MSLFFSLFLSFSLSNTHTHTHSHAHWSAHTCTHLCKHGHTYARIIHFPSCFVLSHTHSSILHPFSLSHPLSVPFSHSPMLLERHEHCGRKSNDYPCVQDRRTCEGKGGGSRTLFPEFETLRWWHLSHGLSQRCSLKIFHIKEVLKDCCHISLLRSQKYKSHPRSHK